MSPLHKISVLVLSFGIFCISARSQSYIWHQSDGPQGGYVAAFANHNGNVYAGGNGGVFVSTDKGKTWTHSGLGGSTISDIVSTGPTLFASSRSEAIFRSTDDGESWTKESTGIPSGVNKIAFLDSFVFAGLQFGGVYRSSNLGSSWSRVDSGFLTLEIINLFSAGNSIIAADYGGMYRSTNYGDSWSRLDPEVNGWSAEKSGTFNGTIFGADHVTVRVSVDSGLTWTSLNTPSPQYDIITSIHIDNRGLYLGTYDHGIFVSPDRTGAYWFNVPNGLSTRTTNAISGTNESLLAATFGGVFLSSNSGGQWRSSNSGLKNSAVVRMVKSDGVIFAGTWGAGIFSSVDSGNSWQPVLSPDPYIIDIYSFRDTLFVIVGYYPYSSSEGGLTFSSTDQGMTWQRWGESLPWLARTMAATDNYFFVATESGIYRTSDSGQSWTVVLNGIFPARRCLAATGTILIAGNSRSTNNGETWAIMDLNITAERFGQVQGFFYAGSRYSSRTYQSKDTGASWQLIDVPLLNATFEDVTGQGPFLAAGYSNRGGVIASFDSGTTWQHYNYGLENLDVRSLLFHENRFLAGTWGNSIFNVGILVSSIQLDTVISPPPGTTNVNTTLDLAWNTSIGASYYHIQVSQNSDFDSLIVDTRISQPRATLSGLNNSSVYYWRVRGEVTGYDWPWISSSFRTKPPEKHLLFQNFPNPFNPNTTIQFELPTPARVSVKIYNLLGQLVETLIDEMLEDGTHQYHWNANLQPSGIYILIVETRDFLQTKKMILLK